MTRFWLSTLILTSLLASLAFAHAATPRTLVAKVERVGDGNALDATGENQSKLRLHPLGIDTPEIPHGKRLNWPWTATRNGWGNKGGRCIIGIITLQPPRETERRVAAMTEP